MTKNILIFRCDRIGDLLLSCPSIKSIKESSPDTELTVVTSEKNFSYAKTLKFFDKVYLFPKKNILKKIIFIKELRKIKYDKIFIYDGKASVYPVLTQQGKIQSITDGKPLK